MRIEILQPIAGRGGLVAGSADLFSLSPGDQVEVEDETAQKWISSGIAKPTAEVRSAQPETTMLAKPPAKSRKGQH